MNRNASIVLVCIAGALMPMVAPARASPCHGDCVNDFDDGSWTGTPDGGVYIDDYLYFLYLYSEGSPCADVDDGSHTGTPDGGVTVDDLLYIFADHCC